MIGSRPGVRTFNPCKWLTVARIKGEKQRLLQLRGKSLTVFSNSHQRALKRVASESALGADGQRCESLNFRQLSSTVVPARLRLAFAVIDSSRTTIVWHIKQASCRSRHFELHCNTLPLHTANSLALLSFISKLFTHHSTYQRIAPRAYRHRTGALQWGTRTG